MRTSPGDRWKLGLLVVLGMGLAFITLLWLGTADLGKRSVRVTSYFDESVQGLDVGSAVKFRGVGIGHVAGISIAPDRRHVAVTSDINIDAFARLGVRGDTELLQQGIMPLDLRVRLVSLGITGLKFLEVDIFDPGMLSTPELPFEPAANHFPSTPSLLKSAEEALTDLLNRFPELQQQTIDTLTAAQITLQTVREAIEPIARALETARVDETSASIRSAANALADAAHEATWLGSEVRDDLVSLRELIQSLNALANHLERDPGSLLRGRSRTSVPRPQGP